MQKSRSGSGLNIASIVEKFESSKFLSHGNLSRKTFGSEKYLSHRKLSHGKLWVTENFHRKLWVTNWQFAHQWQFDGMSLDVNRSKDRTFSQFVLKFFTSWGWHKSRSFNDFIQGFQICTNSNFSPVFGSKMREPSRRYLGANILADHTQ